MPRSEAIPLLRNLDRRVTRIEQILPTLATKEDLKNFPIKDDLKNFATKDDLKNFATKDDLKNFATKDDLKNFATKDDLRLLATKEDLKDFPTRDDPKGFATLDDLREEGDRSRRHMTVLYEEMNGKLDRLLEGYAHLEERLTDHNRRLDNHAAKLDGLDPPVPALEKSRRKN